MRQLPHVMLVLFEQSLHPLFRFSNWKQLKQCYVAPRPWWRQFIELAILIPIILCEKVDDRRTKEIATTVCIATTLDPWQRQPCNQLQIRLFALIAVQKKVIHSWLAKSGANYGNNCTPRAYRVYMVLCNTNMITSTEQYRHHHWFAHAL